MDYFGKRCFQSEDTESWWRDRPRMGTLADALEYDKKFINQLLNRGDEPAKAAIAYIVEYDLWECVENNKVNKSFSDFMQAFYGEKKFAACMHAWLTKEGNEFWARAGMPQEQKPISTILLMPNDEDDE